jgi:glucose/arabinose dehydrogenase
MSHIQMPSLTAMIRAALALVAFSCPLSCHPPDELPSEQAVERIQQAIVLPSGFDRTTIVNDGPTVPSPIEGPTKMAMAPDGRIFIAEHWGGVRIVKNDAVVQTAFLRIPSGNIDTTGSRGLMGIALDPAFASNGFVYLHYTRLGSPSRNRISRFVASTSNPDVAVVDGNGAPVETLIYEMSPQGSANAHNSMPMLFGSDGKLYVATGDNNVGNNAQNTTHTAGKLLRLNPDGSPAAGNPLFNNSNPVEKRLWAKGLRNPWTLARDPVSGRIFFNDVGSLEGGTPDPSDQPWEEANFVPATTTTLLDYGWPNNEGIGSNLVHRYANGPGNDGDDCAIVGGVFYRSSGQTFSFPTQYDGVYFFGDHCSGWIRYLPANQQTPGAWSSNTPAGFATELGGALLDLQVHPDGSLYYIARASVVRDHDAPGIIGRIRPIAVPVPTVTITAPSDGARFSAPASFVVTATASDASGIAKVEFFSNGVEVGEDTSAPYQHSLSGLGQGLYRLTGKATSNQGGIKESDPVSVTVNGPTAIISTPENGATYRAGEPFGFSGSGSDPEDGPLPASALEWNVLLHHGAHVHNAAGPIVGVSSGSFTPNPDDETDHDVFYAVYLTVTDSAGLKHTVWRDVMPVKSTLTLASSPSGLPVKLDSSPQATPHSFLSVVGVHRTLEASHYQVMPGTGALGGQFYQFTSWSDGGARAHQITTPASNTTYTASFSQIPWSSSDIGAVGAAGGFNLSSGTFTVDGSGVDIWGTADEFRFAYVDVTGDVTISARVKSLENTNGFAKAGVMLRDGTAANAANAYMFLTPTAANGYRFQRRTAAGGTTVRDFAGSSSTPSWVRLERAGNVFRAYYSPDGNSWTNVGGDVSFNMPATLKVGLAVTSHADGVVATSVFDQVVITGPGPAQPPTPPNPPSGLVANDGTGQVTLLWTDNSNDETLFRIERRTLPSGSFSEINTVAANVVNYTDSPLAAGNYEYRVRASNGAVNSSYSNTDAAAVTAPSGPAAPSDLGATVSVGNAVNLTWTDNSNNETGFQVERKTGAGSYTVLASKPANTTSHTDPALAPNTYTYRVIATGSPNSAPSNEVVVIIRNPAADAYVRSGTSASTNFGTATVLEAKHTNTTTTKRNAFLRFSLSGVAATVTSAKLRLYGNAVTSAKATSVHSVADVTWIESGTGGITWNYPTTDAGGPATSPNPLSTQTVGTTATFTEWDVTAYVQQQRTAGATAVTLGVKSGVLSDEGPSTFHSREGTNKPLLIISSRP